MCIQHYLFILTIWLIMKMQKKDLGTQAINFRLAVCKVCITACFAMALSLFLFACESSNSSGSTDSSAASMQNDTTTTAPVDTATMPVDSATRPDSTTNH
ncbi:hypothetical protein SIO70_20975 [Chitinophaga sancti]|uniref:hypothetical protein n=1 Tax=Chitinophaga sancti TaxID=1004 RepID=UPI002A74E936|nr:hypothetical protein [Chitinophaga sancti]WPQ60832.1 hypothetical protein SIO70_20975 [Chitinophaga sancti]